MKRIFVFVLLLSICLSGLCACKINHYQVEVTGETENLMEPLESSYRAGSKVCVVLPVICDAGLYVFVNGEELVDCERIDGRDVYTFTMPEENVSVHITFDRYYGQEEFDVSMLEYLDDTMEITEVSVITTDISEKGHFSEVKTTTLPSDIEKIKVIFHEMLIRGDDYYESKPEKSIKYYITYKDKSGREQSRAIEFEDRYYMQTGFYSARPFKIQNDAFVLPDIEEPSSVFYRFPFDKYLFHIKKYDDENFGVDVLQPYHAEFVRYDGEVGDVAPTYYIDLPYGRINLLTETIFELNGQYYEITTEESTWVFNEIKAEEEKG